jgi:hypothetical protein
MRVYATSERFAKDMSKVVSRLGRMRFTSDGWAEWPDDQFTRRRLRDGDITLEPPKKAEPKKVGRSETPSA